MTVTHARASATVNDNCGQVAVTIAAHGGGITIILPPNKANALAAAILASVKRVSTIGDSAG